MKKHEIQDGEPAFQHSCDDCKSERTQGPWHVGMRPGPMVYGPMGEQVADCRGLDESGYNARFIASAPDLLATLKEVSEAGHDGHLVGLIGKMLLASIDEAISKAEGR